MYGQKMKWLEEVYDQEMEQAEERPRRPHRQPIVGFVFHFGPPHSAYSKPPREGKPTPILVDIAPCNHRTVTYVSGFEIFGLATGTLAKGLETACESSTTVQPDPKNPEWKRIMVRGEHSKAVVACLIAEGVPRLWIKAINHESRRPKRGRTGRSIYQDLLS